MKRLFYVYDQNGMANRLFPFAHLLAFGLEHGIQIVNPVFDRYAGYFVGTAENTREAFWSQAVIESPAIKPPSFDAPAWRWRSRWLRRISSKRWAATEPSQCTSLSELNDLDCNDVWLSSLYAIDNKSFEIHASILRRCFEPVDQVRGRVDETMRSARQRGDLLVGVHIRQGDYRTFADGMMYFETSEYAKLMQHAQRLWGDRNVVFVVCSDTEQSSDGFGDLQWVEGPGDEAGDLFTLAGCDYLIAPQSTFSQWASWYGGTPRYIHNKKYEAAYGVETRELTPKEFRIHKRGFGKFESPPGKLSKPKNSLAVH